MRDIELYEAILGLIPPWKVIHVELDVADMEVTVKVDAGPSPFRSRPVKWCRLGSSPFVTS